MKPEPVLLAALLLATPVNAESRFEPIPMPDHSYEGGWEHYVGGGVAVFDCNGDTYPEIFAAGGTKETKLFINQTGANSSLSFTTGTAPNVRITGATGAYPIDINADSHMDLVVLRVGENILLKGGPNCSFTSFETLNFTSGDRWTTAFSAAWEPDADLPTLAFGNYVDRTDPDGPFEACDINTLYRPNGSEYPEPTPLTPGYCALSMLFSDWSRQGHPDLRVSNDRQYYVRAGREQLWRLTTPPSQYSKADGWQTHRLWGMGIASRDITGDGLPEVMMTSMGDQRLQLRDTSFAGPHYIDAPYGLGTTAHRPFMGGDGRPSTGWHVAFGDVQNDGRDDIFIVKGNVEQMPGLAMKDPNNLLIQNGNGTFTEHADTAGTASFHRGRGGALADLDQDGKLDMVVVNRRAPLEVFHNVTAETGNWLSITLTQNAPNKNAIGAWIELTNGTRTISRELTIGGGHASGQFSAEHFGLGQWNFLKARIIWPDGGVSDWQTLAANARYRLTRTDDNFQPSVY